MSQILRNVSRKAKQEKEQSLLETIHDINAGIGLSKPYSDEDEMWRDLGVDMKSLRQQKAATEGTILETA